MRKTVEIRIEKVHFEDRMYIDMITVWEVKTLSDHDCIGVRIFESLKKQIKELQKTFNTRQDWAYDVAHASIYVDGKPLTAFEQELKMPCFYDIPHFLVFLDACIEYEEEEYLIALDNLGGDYLG